MNAGALACDVALFDEVDADSVLFEFDSTARNSDPPFRASAPDEVGVEDAPVEVGPCWICPVLVPGVAELEPLLPVEEVAAGDTPDVLAAVRDLASLPFARAVSLPSRDSTFLPPVLSSNRSSLAFFEPRLLLLFVLFPRSLIDEALPDSLSADKLRSPFLPSPAPFEPFSPENARELSTSSLLLSAEYDSVFTSERMSFIGEEGLEDSLLNGARPLD